MTQVFVFLLCVAFGSLVLGRYMKYIFNSPELHIWHHSFELPKDKRYGINFALTLAVWDYLFKTAYLPFEGRDIKLGFPGIEKYPHNFLVQSSLGFGKTEFEKKEYERVLPNDLPS